MGKASRNKGKTGERELAKKLTELFGHICRRGQQFCGLEGKDVVGLPGVHVECKRTERLSLYPAIEQAKSDAGSGEVPVVFHRQNGKEWLAIIPADSLPALIANLSDSTVEGDGLPVAKDGTGA